MDMRIRPGRDYLTIVISGDFEIDSANALTPLILDACATRGAAKVVVDARGVRGTVSLAERYVYAETFARLYHERRVAGRLPHVQFAFVADPPILDPQRFGEKVAAARGLHVKAVSTVEEALAWLEGKPPQLDAATRVLPVRRGAGRNRR